MAFACSTLWQVVINRLCNVRTKTQILQKLTLIVLPSRSSIINSSTNTEKRFGLKKRTTKNRTLTIVAKQESDEITSILLELGQVQKNINCTKILSSTVFACVLLCSLAFYCVRLRSTVFACIRLRSLRNLSSTLRRTEQCCQISESYTEFSDFRTPLCVKF